MSENSTALVIGDIVKPVGIQVGDKLFVFTKDQIQFLLNLQKMKNVTAAGLSIGKDEDWGKRFLASAKFKAYISCKVAEYSVKNGMTVEWWYQFGKWLTDGYKEQYHYDCTFCKWQGKINTYEAESYRDDDMMLRASCVVCYKPIEPILEREDFKPTREQVEGWKEIGSRILPKIERVHHEFEKSEIIFSTNEGG